MLFKLKIKLIIQVRSKMPQTVLRAHHSHNNNGHIGHNGYNTGAGHHHNNGYVHQNGHVGHFQQNGHAKTNGHIGRFEKFYSNFGEGANNKFSLFPFYLFFF